MLSMLCFCECTRGTAYLLQSCSICLQFGIVKIGNESVIAVSCIYILIWCANTCILILHIQNSLHHFFQISTTHHLSSFFRHHFEMTDELPTLHLSAKVFRISYHPTRSYLLAPKLTSERMDDPSTS